MWLLKLLSIHLILAPYAIHFAYLNLRSYTKTTGHNQHSAQKIISVQMSQPFECSEVCQPIFSQRQYVVERRRTYVLQASDSVQCSLGSLFAQRTNYQSTISVRQWFVNIVHSFLNLTALDLHNMDNRFSVRIRTAVDFYRGRTGRAERPKQRRKERKMARVHPAVGNVRLRPLQNQLANLVVLNQLHLSAGSTITWNTQCQVTSS